MDRSMNYVSPVPIPPGETLIEALEEKGMTQSDLAMRMGRPIKTINGIIKGKVAITADTAMQLEYVLDVPAYFWQNLESAYRTSIVRQREQENIAKESDMAKKFPYTEMAKLGWVSETKDLSERIRALKRFFGVVSLKNVPAREAIAFRRSGVHENSDYAIAAWLRKGELEAQNIETDNYDEDKFKSALVEIKLLAYEMPSDFSVILRDMCSECGVTVVYIPHLQKTHVNGATHWLAPKKAIIQLSNRYPYEDVFWFSFFHEAGHILLHGKRDVFIEYKNMTGSKKEEEANRFAANSLIGADDYNEILKDAPFSHSKIRLISKRLSVSPGVLVGRLAHDKHIPYSKYGDLRRKLIWRQ
ncbi:MAG: ImmA/IrrE family metallo-endopeptidase [Nitrospinota bacterium]|nr:ImmA/IrrE family metallo-endopeptidase [Nitrospinota bacterium]